MTVSPNAELRPPPSEGLGPRRFRAAAALDDDVSECRLDEDEEDFLWSLEEEDEVEVLVVCAEAEEEANLAVVWLSWSLCMCSAA